MVNHPNRGKRTVKMTKAQIMVLIYAAEFVLAGEWPWDDLRADTLEDAVAALNAATTGD